MEDLSKIIRIVFTDNIGILIFISFSWLLMYWGLKLLEATAGKILLRWPYYLGIRFWRIQNGTPNLRRAISTLKTHENTKTRIQASKIGDYISRIDHDLSRASNRNMLWLPNFFLRKSSFEKETKRIFKNDIALLEGDQTFYEVLSGDVSTVTKGLLYAVGSPLLNPQEVIGILFHVLQFGPLQTRDISLCLAKSRVKNESQIEDLSKIISEWKGEFRKKGERAIEEIRDKLISEGLIGRTFSAQSNK